MKLLRWLLPLWCALALAQTPGFNYYVPANGVQYNTGASPIDTAATAAQIAATYAGQSGCSGATALLFNATCSIVGSGTVTSIAAGSGLSGGTITGSGTIALQTPVAANFGGTGEAGTLTGILKGNSTGAFTLALAADTAATYTGASGCSGAAALLFNGQCSGLGTGTVTSVACGTGLSGGTFTTTGTCAIAATAVTAGTYTNTNITVGADGRLTAATSGSGGSGCSLANPTATIGLTAVNGSAGTCMRSDAAPALSQAISPTMTGTWTFSNPSANSIVPSTATFAEDWHLIDQQSGGHNYGGISGYCNGAAAGTWSLFDYTASASRICIGPLGNLTVNAPSAGSAIYATQTSGASTPANAAINATGAVSASGDGNSVSLYMGGGSAIRWPTAGGDAYIDDQSSGSTVHVRLGGIDTLDTSSGVTNIVSGTLEQGGTAVCLSNGTNCPSTTQTTGTFSLTYTSGCNTGTSAASGNYTKEGNFVTLRVTAATFCSSQVSSVPVFYTGLPSAIQPAGNAIVSVPLSNATSSFFGGQSPGLCLLTNSATVECEAGPFASVFLYGLPVGAIVSYQLN